MVIFGILVVLALLVEGTLYATGKLTPTRLSATIDTFTLAAVSLIFVLILINK